MSDLQTAPTLEFLLPGDPLTLTGGYIYDHRIQQALSALGWDLRVHSLDASFPFPHPAALEQADATLGKIAAGHIVVIDGLALGAMPEIAAKHTERLKLVALIHHPLAAETGLSAEQQDALDRSEHEALRRVERIIVTSNWTKHALIEAGVRGQRITVVRPGTDPAPLAQGSAEPPLKLLCVATLTLRKGHAVLFDALAQIRGRPWQLDCVGSAKRDPATAEALERQLARLRLTQRVRLLGELPAAELEACYEGADLFVLASYLEGYGMAHAEALAHGLPIVTTSAGAVPETVPADAALIVPPGDRGAFARALASVIDDAALRDRLRLGARRAREGLPSWTDAGALFAAALETLR